MVGFLGDDYDDCNHDPGRHGNLNQGKKDSICYNEPFMKFHGNHSLIYI